MIHIYLYLLKNPPKLTKEFGNLIYLDSATDTARWSRRLRLTGEVGADPAPTPQVGADPTPRDKNGRSLAKLEIRS